MLIAFRNHIILKAVSNIRMCSVIAVFYKNTKSMDLEEGRQKKYPHGPILAFTSMATVLIVVKLDCAIFFQFSQKGELA